MPGIVLALAGLVRFTHGDVAWFGFDQIRFMYDARRILSGEWNVAGPDAGGLDILGPLYSYVISPLLLVRDAPDIVGLFGVTCDVAACWLAFDAARRLTDRTSAFAAAVTYLAAPVLVLGTRMIWNPSLLSSLVMLAWWLAVRYAQSPSLWRLVCLAFVAGVLPSLHATGVLHASGLVVAALTAHRPRIAALAAAASAGILPLLPTLTRMTEGSGLTGLGARVVAPSEAWFVLTGLDRIVLSFPLGAAPGHPVSTLSVAVLHIQAAVAVFGGVALVAPSTRQRAVVAGLITSLTALFVSAFFYSQPLAWHHFMAAVPPACLLVALALQSVPWRGAAAGVVAGLALLHLPFVYVVDRNAIASGVMRINLGGMYLRVPPVEVGSLIVPEMRRIGGALRGVVPDGATAMMVAHGLRGELWRETGAEYLSSASTPTAGWGTEFVLMDRGARAAGAGARVIDDRVCAFAAPAALPWRMHAGRPPAGWEQADYHDGDWAQVSLPRRPASASHTPAPALAQWPAPAMAFRAPLQIAMRSTRRIVSVTIHTGAAFEQQLTTFFLNGQALVPIKQRAIQSSLYRNREWLFDLSAAPLGRNVIAITIEGTAPHFDVDVFDVPCTDGWY